MKADAAGFRVARLEAGVKNPWVAWAIFGGVLAVYLATFFGALVADSPWSWLLSAANGWTIGMLFVVGHDASHQSFSASRRINDLVGRISFFPSLHALSLWDIGHNKTHHLHNNVRGFDYVWEPMTPEDYASASTGRRAAYRFFRSVPGVPFYYAARIWFPKMFFPRKDICGRRFRECLFDTSLVWAFLAVQLATAAIVGPLFGKGIALSIVLGMLLPFVIWNLSMSVVIYMHHTHPKVRWYSSVEEWRREDGKVNGTVHVRFPFIMRMLMLEIMEHNAHHAAPNIPLYNLSDMQGILDTSHAVEWRWSIPELIRIINACKLFDYGRGEWVGFAAVKSPQPSGPAHA